MLLSKDEILAKSDLPFEDVDVPEWGGTVRVRTMTGTERDSWESSVYINKGESIEINREQFRAQLLARVIVNEKGDRLFTDKEISALSGKSSKALDRLFVVAQELNAVGRKEAEDLKKK